MSGIFSPPRLLRRQSSRHQLRNFSFDLTERNSNDSYEFDPRGGDSSSGTQGILLLVKSPEIAKKPKNSVELVDSRNRNLYFFVSDEFKDDPIFEWGLKGVLRLKEPESPYKPNSPTPPGWDNDSVDRFYIFDEEDPVLKGLYALENTYEVRELIFLYMWEEQRKTELVRAARQMETNIRELTNSSFTPGVYGYRAYMEIAEVYHTVENRLAFKKYCDSCQSAVIQFACPSTGNVFCSKKCAQRYFI